MNNEKKKKVEITTQLSRGRLCEIPYKKIQKAPKNLPRPLFGHFV
jgi:hypothetical protein